MHKTSLDSGITLIFETHMCSTNMVMRRNLIFYCVQFSSD